MDSPAAFLPATVCHELAHQRGITAEEECNFIGILAAVRSEDAGYRYSGWLTGFGYLFNALYSADREAWQVIRDALPDTVVADLRADNAYWAQFRGVVSKVSDTVYDSFLKSNGDTDGSKSYGVVTDLLVAYFGIKKYSLRPVGLREYFLLVRLIRRSLRAVYWDHPMLIRSSTII